MLEVVLYEFVFLLFNIKQFILREYRKAVETRHSGARLKMFDDILSNFEHNISPLLSKLSCGKQIN